MLAFGCFSFGSGVEKETKRGEERRGEEIS